MGCSSHSSLQKKQPAPARFTISICSPYWRTSGVHWPRHALPHWTAAQRLPLLSGCGTSTMTLGTSQEHPKKENRLHPSCTHLCWPTETLAPGTRLPGIRNLPEQDLWPQGRPWEACASPNCTDEGPERALGIGNRRHCHTQLGPPLGPCCTSVLVHGLTPPDSRLYCDSP